MVCFTTKLLQPKASYVVDPLITSKPPEQVPRIPVLMYKHLLLSLLSRKNATGIGSVRSTVSAGLDMIDLFSWKQYLVIIQHRKLQTHN